MNFLKNIFSNFGHSKRGRNVFLLTAISAFSALGFFSSCSDKEIAQEQDIANSGYTGDPSKGIYLLLDLKMPATRSETTPSGGSSGDVNGNYDTLPSEENEDKMGGFYLSFYSEADASYDRPLLGPLEGDASGSSVRVAVTVDQMKEIAGKKVKVLLSVNITGSANTPDGIFSMGDTVEDEDSPIGDFGTDGKGKAVPLANYEEFTVDLTALDPTAPDFLETLMSLLDPSRTLYLSTDVRLNEDGLAAGTMELERCVARVDFKPNKGVDAELSTATKTAYLDNNIYSVGEIPNLYAQMDNLQIVNISKQSFIFRHTSDGNTTGANDDGSIFGIENFNENFGQDKPEDFEGTDDDWKDTATQFKWVADNDWDQKSNWAEGNDTYYEKGGPYLDTDVTTIKKYEYFLNQPTKEEDAPFYYIHPDQGNLYGVLPVASLPQGEYKYWLYMSENTLPSTKAMINGLTTGIAFNMFLCDKDGNPLKVEDFITQEQYFKNESDYETDCDQWLVKFENWKSQNGNSEKTQADYEAENPDNKYPVSKNKGKVVGSFKRCIINNTDSEKFYELSIGSKSVYAVKSKVYLPDKTKAKDSKTGLYPLKETTDDAFMITYYYYFRHNISKDHQLGVTEPMQFAVVRNNIYKVSVTSLNGLPEPYEPSRPDEPEENYISVELNILSWAIEDREVYL